VADTVVIGAGGTAETLTRFCNSDWGAVSYEIKDDEESEGDADDYEDELGSPSRCARPDIPTCIATVLTALLGSAAVWYLCE